MKCRIILLAVLYCVKQCGILEEITILNFFCDSCKFLIYDTSGTHIKMTDLGIAHLPLRKSYCKSARVTAYIRIFFHKFVKNGFLCFGNGVMIRALVKSVSVHYA